MLLGRVAGTLVASRKEERMEGLKLLVVRQLEVDGKEGGGYVVAVDAVGAGIGEVVLYATGSSARQTVYTHERPCDAVIMGIVDTWEVGGETVWSKSVAPPPAPARARGMSPAAGGRPGASPPRHKAKKERGR